MDMITLAVAKKYADNVLELAKRYTDEELLYLNFMQVVEELPQTGLPNKIYLVVKKDQQAQDLFDECMWIDEKWEWITTKQIEIDLTPYVKKEEGKGLSTNDYTTEEKTKVAKVPNTTAADAGKFLRVDANGNIITETM